MQDDLKKIARDVRCDVIRTIGHLGVGHIGGCLSVVELLTVLYFEAMRIDPRDPKMPGRDRFICSKSHAGPTVYAALANRGYFGKDVLLTLNQGGTSLPSHCNMKRIPVCAVGVEDRFGEVGRMPYLKQALGLTKERVKEAAREAIGLKDIRTLSF